MNRLAVQNSFVNLIKNPGADVKNFEVEKPREAALDTAHLIEEPADVVHRVLAYDTGSFGPVNKGESSLIFSLPENKTNGTEI
jgi:hypothetical protein